MTLPPQVWCPTLRSGDGDRWFASEELVMEGFVREKKDFELYLLLDRERVEVLEDRSDVIMRVRIGEQKSSSVLDVLKLI